MQNAASCLLLVKSLLGYVKSCKTLKTLKRDKKNPNLETKIRAPASTRTSFEVTLKTTFHKRLKLLSSGGRHSNVNQTEDKVKNIKKNKKK